MFGWASLVIVWVPVVGWASSVAVVGGLHDGLVRGTGTGRSVTENCRKTSLVKMILSTDHIPEDLNPDVMLH